MRRTSRPRAAAAAVGPRVVDGKLVLRKPPAPRNVPAKIRRMARIIVKQFDPERVILFGSRARGDARPDSDVDLLVVMESGKSRRELSIDIAVALQDVDIAKDILVVWSKDFAWRRDMMGTIEYPAAKEGVALYSRG